ncbi:conjugal transfer protein [Blastococcus sp. TF02-09]|uniref:conjugal transfer protein n=1 Tax=Blastococcus sp. TF02-09 TaxID=2250576 RepID=UPI001F1D82DD|nr:conjugal transfer protein [Blastococcus sp. TF02-9]
MAAGGTLIAVALAALAGLGIASALWGGGWVWPHGTDTVVRVLGGLLHGHPGRGLPPDQLRQVAGPVPAYACIAAAELVLVSGALTTAVLAVRYRRPGDARGGMATRREAEQALGLRQLRAGRAVIRPDRYPSRRGRGCLRRLLSTGGDAVRRRAHRSGASPYSGSTAPRPSTAASRSTARFEKESYR